MLWGQNKDIFNSQYKSHIENAVYAAIYDYLKHITPSGLKDSIIFNNRDIVSDYQKIYAFSLTVRPFFEKFNKYPIKNFYMVQMNEQYILDPLSWKSDTNLLKKYSKYYPFAGQYLVYYDTLLWDGPRILVEGPQILSGQCDVLYFLNRHDRYYSGYLNSHSAALFRMFSFGIKKSDQVHTFYSKLDHSFDWLYVDSCKISFSCPAIIKVPNIYLQNPYNQYDKIEVLFYTDTIPTKPDATRKGEIKLDTVIFDPNIEYEVPKPIQIPLETRDIYEVKYIFYNKPKSYEESLIPHFRKLSDAEKKKLVDFLADERQSIEHFFIDSKTLYEKMSPYHLLPKQ